LVMQLTSMLGSGAGDVCLGRWLHAVGGASGRPFYVDHVAMAELSQMLHQLVHAAGVVDRDHPGARVQRPTVQDHHGAGLVEDLLVAEIVPPMGDQHSSTTLVTRSS